MEKVSGGIGRRDGIGRKSKVVGPSGMGSGTQGDSGGVGDPM